MIGPLNQEEIDYVTSNLGTQSKYEMNVLNVSLGQIKKKFEAFIGKPFSVVLYQSGTPCALVILEMVGDMRWRSWYVSTDDMNRATRRNMTKLFKGFLSDLSGRGGTIETMCSGDEKWHKALGFSVVGQGEDNRITKYEINGR